MLGARSTAVPRTGVWGSPGPCGIPGCHACHHHRQLFASASLESRLRVVKSCPPTATRITVLQPRTAGTRAVPTALRCARKRLGNDRKIAGIQVTATHRRRGTLHFSNLLQLLGAWSLPRRNGIRRQGQVGAQVHGIHLQPARVARAGGSQGATRQALAGEVSARAHQRLGRPASPTSAARTPAVPADPSLGHHKVAPGTTAITTPDRAHDSGRLVCSSDVGFE
mmetsp:Transcript_26658/g.58769  ORF Transcript_26658/g.58769 Transcript_26658/m.58769 type:complete len:224 (-) Transcript_26658:1268-1939(-)